MQNEENNLKENLIAPLVLYWILNWKSQPGNKSTLPSMMENNPYAKKIHVHGWNWEDKKCKRIEDINSRILNKPYNTHLMKSMLNSFRPLAWVSESPDWTSMLIMANNID